MPKKYIDADLFLQRMIKKYHCKPILDGGGSDYGYLHLELNKQPAADVTENKQGKWEWFNCLLGTYNQCSVCKRKFKIRFEDLYKYELCPSCGAKMQFDE